MQDGTLDDVDWGQPVNWSSPFAKRMLLWFLAVPNRMGFGSTRWRDMVQRTQNHGTLTGVTPPMAWVGKRTRPGGFGALNFSLVSTEYVASSFAVDSSQPFSVNWWMYPTRFSAASDDGIWTLGTHTGTTDGLGAFLFDNASYSDITWNMPTSADAGLKAPLNKTVANNWHYCSIAYRGGTINDPASWKFYADGISKTVTSSAGTFSFINNTKLGLYDSGTDKPFSGPLDSFMVLSGAQNDAFYAALYQEEIAGYPNLLNRISVPYFAPAAAGGFTKLAGQHNSLAGVGGGLAG